MYVTCFLVLRYRKLHRRRTRGSDRGSLDSIRMRHHRGLCRRCLRPESQGRARAVRPVYLRQGIIRERRCRLRPEQRSSERSSLLLHEERETCRFIMREQLIAGLLRECRKSFTTPDPWQGPEGPARSPAPPKAFLARRMGSGQLRAAHIQILVESSHLARWHSKRGNYIPKRVSDEPRSRVLSNVRSKPPDSRLPNGLRYLNWTPIGAPSPRSSFGQGIATT